MKKYFIVILSIVFIESCSNPGSGPGGGYGSTVVPKAGSTFTFRFAPIDSNGVILIDSALTVFDSVAESGISYKGKNNVNHIISYLIFKDGSRGTGEDYLNYE